MQQRYEADKTDSTLRLMTVKEAASRLAVSRSTVYRILEDGSLPSVRVRSDVRVAERDLQAFIERRRATSATG